MHYHIVGIAGAGMSAIAHILLDQGHTVSGSDLSANQATALLSGRGARVYQGHDPGYVAGADVLLTTSAARADHPELLAAQAQGIPLRKRADLWRDWSQQRAVIAVAGTHGKTTTTAMIALVLMRAGFDPGFLIGADVPDLGVSARWGDPAAPLLIEADEYDRTFLALRPRIAVITNIEWDHPDIYPTATDYFAAFAQFAAQTSEVMLLGEGCALGDIPVRRSTYGLAEGSDYRAVLLEQTPLTRFSVGAAQFTLQVPGLHNVHNALAAVAVADQLGVATPLLAAALHDFRGTGRRFELKGSSAGITVVDDYAHHPTEVRATLAAARQWVLRSGSGASGRVVAYLQPHTFSRTMALFDLWPHAFADADLVLVGDIYAAREQGDAAALAQRLTAHIAAVHPAVQYVGNVAAAVQATLKLLQPGDLLLTLGAGDGYRVGEAVLAAGAS